MTEYVVASNGWGYRVLNEKMEKEKQENAPTEKKRNC